MASWRALRSGNLGKLAQLRADLHTTFGQLLTQCHVMAKSDPDNAAHWEREATRWEDLHREGLALVDEMLEAASHLRGRTSQAPQSVTVGDISAGGDVTITVIRDSQHTAAGKNVGQSTGTEHA